MKKIFNFQKIKKFDPRNILLINIVVFGLVFVLNSMIRFENQVLSCSFWLLCEDQTISQYQTIFNFQTFFAVLGLCAVFYQSFQKEITKYLKARRVMYSILVTISIFLVTNSLFAFLPSQIRILMQILFSLMVSLMLTFIYVETNDNLNDHHQKNRLHEKIRLLTISSLLMVALGVITSIAQSSLVCDQFPLCFSQHGFRVENLLINMHRILTLFTGLVLVSALDQTWRKYREKLSLMIPITVGFSIFIGQSLVGAVQIFRNLDLNLLFIHSISSFVYLLSLIFVYRKSAFIQESDNEYKLTFFNDSLRRKDYLILNKPIIVALLLVTTFAGMVVGGEKIPSFSLTFWTMVGGALAAGGASAINQFIDRKIDLSMQRTAKRPLPAGRLYPAEALALGVAEIIFSFYIFTAFVNLNAALLAMIGMVYYVIIYSKWLKHATVQNIVIGGGAGAIPPLVGWAAATGGLNVPSIFLFALVFLWTPPHFWALALIRKNDYARANIPMMPVIRGEEKTRFQILIYTIQLVLLTLLMPLFGVGGGVYFVLAVVLGLWLLSTAWQVYRNGGNKIAFKMYRYSSMYLAFIFLALVVDVLV